MKQTITDLAQAIRKHRKQAGLTQAELAALSGTGKTAVYDIEHGKQTVRLDTVLKILQALNIRFELRSPLTNQGKEASRAKRNS